MVKDTQGIRDIYSGICSKLVKLCPRLVPSPLWRLSLARIARMAPQATFAICNICPETVEKIHHYWMNLNRSGTCEICGGAGNEVDEDWLYYVFDENGKLVRDITAGYPPPEKTNHYKGVAYLQRLRLLCGKCHLAKHQGYALVHERKQEALEHLAEVNQLSLEETKKYVDKAFHIHSQLSKIHNWTIKIGELKGLGKELRKRAEELLNIMYAKGFFLSDGWLYYRYPRHCKEVEPRIIRETINILTKASKRSGTSNVVDDKWINSLLENVKEKLESRSISVLNHEFRLFMKYLLENERRKKRLQEIVNYISKGKAGDHRDTIILLLHHANLAGKWMVFVPTNLYPKIFRYILGALEKAKLAYHAKIMSGREEFSTEKELPIIIYVPIAFATHHIIEVAEVMRRVLDGFHINERRMFFKPDLFTIKGVYSGKTNQKPYIYETIL